MLQLPDQCLDTPGVVGGGGMCIQRIPVALEKLKLFLFLLNP